MKKIMTHGLNIIKRKILKFHQKIFEKKMLVGRTEIYDNNHAKTRSNRLRRISSMHSEKPQDFKISITNFFFLFFCT